MPRPRPLLAPVTTAVVPLSWFVVIAASVRLRRGVLGAEDLSWLDRRRLANSPVTADLISQRGPPEHGDEPVAWAGEGPDSHWFAEQTGPRGAVHNKRGDLEQIACQDRRDGPGPAASGGDVPAVDGELDRASGSDEASGQVPVVDGDLLLGSAGGAHAKQQHGLGSERARRVRIARRFDLYAIGGVTRRAADPA